MTEPIRGLPEKTGAPWAFCNACRYCFRSVAGFEQHRRGGECLNPKDVGLVLDETPTIENGMWGETDGMDRYNSRQANLGNLKNIPNLASGVDQEATISPNTGNGLYHEGDGIIRGK